MKTIAKYLFIAAVSALALASCSKVENEMLNPSGTPVKLTLTGDKVFSESKAAIKLTSDVPVPAELSVKLSLDAASTIKSENITFPDLTIKAGETEASGNLELDPTGLRPGTTFKIIVKGTLAGVDLGTKVELSYTTEAAPEPEPVTAAITIDGDMSDWAEIKGVASEDGPIYAFKAAYDVNNVYFYVKRNNNSAMWGGGYLYFDFDLDSNPNTGTEKDNITGLETWIFLYFFLADEGGNHYVADAPEGEMWTGGESGSQAAFTCPANSCKGVFDDDYAEVEIALSRTSLGIKSGDDATIYTWGNKSGSNLKSEPIYLKFND